MADQKKKFEKYVSPRGVFVYPKLNKADEYKGKSTYNVKLRLDTNDTAAKAFVEKVQAQHAAAVEAARVELTEKAQAETDPKKKKKISEALAKLAPWTCPARAVVLDDGTDSPNLVEVTFKMPATRKDKKTQQDVAQRPDLIDAKRNKLDPAKVSIWGGTEGKIAGFFFPTYNPGQNTAGVSMRMQAAQILKLVSSGNGDHGFADEEGFTADEGDDSTDPFANETPAETPAGEAPTSGVSF